MYALVIILAIIGIALVVLAAYRRGQEKAHSTIQLHVQPPEITITTKEVPKEPETPPQDSPEQDAWEGWFLEAPNPRTVETTLRIGYTDSKGKTTERVVDVRQYDENHFGGMMIGHCRLRQGTRTFSLDRIDQCVVEGTGEVVEDVRTFLRGLYEKSVHSTIDRLREEEFDLLRVLLYVGKADGRLLKKEVDVIVEMCRDTTGDQRISSDTIRKMLDWMEVPTLNQFRKSVGKMVSLPEDKKLSVINFAERIVATQKTIHPIEQDAIDYIKKKLSKTAIPS
jgi:hypothetical protein